VKKLKRFHRGDLVCEPPYPERGVVIKVFANGGLEILCPNGKVQKFGKKYVQKLTLVHAEEKIPTSCGTK
tara:strand:+ start:390 stop:599 length:210 start_codon:yes stop_codon:yes gene_type:complete